MKKAKIQKIIEDFEREHNHSWYEELYQRNEKTIGDTALYYRGNQITYNEMFERMRLLAGALQSIGVKKGTEIPVCLSNTPELVYVMGAASILGAKINVFNASFPLEYIKEIVDGCDSSVGFFEDNFFTNIYDVIKTTTLRQFILCSLGDSLPSGVSPKSVKGQGLVNFESSIDKWIANDSKVIGFYEFMKSGASHQLVLTEPVHLEDEFTVTYTSGSTNALHPKAIVQCVRSFCVIGRFHDPDLTYGMQTKKYRWIANVPPNSNTDMISCISDALMQGAVLALEPIYDPTFFLESILLNRPAICVATRSFWLTAMKQLMTEKEYENKKLTSVIMPFAAGEELSINEEQFLNRALRKAEAGKDHHHLPISPVCFCVGGGDCEHGSIFHRLFRAITNFSLFKSSEKRYGMSPFDFVDVAVLDEKGNRLGANQVGRLVAKSPCTMKCYKNDPESTNVFFIKDANGEVWGDMSVFGYMDKKGRVYMRNRIWDDSKDIPSFKIADEILRSKAFLSCEVVKVKEGFVAHVEFVPGCKASVDDELLRAKRRCLKRFGADVSENIQFRIHSGIVSFPLTNSGKRDVKALIALQ